MSKYPELNEQKLAELRISFVDAEKKIRELPDQINDCFDEIKTKAFGIWLMFTDERDEIQEKLKKLISTLADLVQGAFAPWLFVDYADKWQQVGAAVGRVNGIQNDNKLDMEGQWDGSAYKSFKQSKLSQTTAMTTITGLCEKIHENLLTVAEEGRIMYKAVVDKLATVLAEVSVAIIETEATAGAAALWTVNNMNSAIVAAVELVVELVTNFAEVQTKVWIAQNELQNMIKAPVGLVNSEGNAAWPSPEAQEYDNKDDDWRQDGKDD
ncbi:hypothetical protein ACFVMC_23330 [Nocardia sp. NPDC127579]|uniref:hypothetical protein n=1 Tax=Nocardia sp. NPDC127579 TaxID=3345402 RepID=UPI00363E1C3E